MNVTIKENVLAACEQILWRNRKDKLTTVKLYTKTNCCFLFDKDIAVQLVHSCSDFVSTSKLFACAKLHPDYNGFGDIKQNYNKYKTAFVEVDVSKDILPEFEEIVKSRTHLLTYEVVFNVVSDKTCNETTTVTTDVLDRNVRALRSAENNKLITVTPDENPFDYNPESHMLTILGKTNAKIRIGIAGMVDFMHSIKPLLENRYKPYNGPDIVNTSEALRDRLIKENYVKLPGPIDCEVWGCFNNDIENLLMLEIIYPYTGSHHINVAIDLSKF